MLKNTEREYYRKSITMSHSEMPATVIPDNKTPEECFVCKHGQRKEGSFGGERKSTFGDFAVRSSQSEHMTRETEVEHRYRPGFYGEKVSSCHRPK